MKINIAIDLLSTKYGGGKYYILNQLKELSNYRNRYKIICIVSDNNLQKGINDLGYKTIFLKSDNLMQSILNRIIIFNIILKKNNVDLVYYPNNFIYPFLGYKNVVFFQNVKVFKKGLDSSDVREKFKYLILNILSRFSIKKADVKIYVSNEIRSLAKDYNKSKVINYGKPNWKISKNIRKKRYILNVSTANCSQKNMKVLIDGFKLFNKNHKDMILKIIGNIKEESIDNIQYVGYVNNKEIQKYYSKALIYIWNSMYLIRYFYIS
jgi:glycosyltransferase involved in cell wall biosynthesis